MRQHYIVDRTVAFGAAGGGDAGQAEAENHYGLYRAGKNSKLRTTREVAMYFKRRTPRLQSRGAWADPPSYSLDSCAYVAGCVKTIPYSTDMVEAEMFSALGAIAISFSISEIVEMYRKDLAMQRETSLFDSLVSLGPLYGHTHLT